MKRFCVMALVCALAGMASACVSKGKYVELETDLEATREAAEQGDRALEELQRRYAELTAKNELLSADLDELQSEFRTLEGEKLMLSSRVDELTRDLNRERSVVQSQSEVINELEDTRRKIESGLKVQIEAQEIKIEEMEGKLKVTFVDKILFDSGSSRINERGRESLRDLARSFQGTGEQLIVVEGHTDNVKVGAALRSRYPSNWELSTARATAVVRFLQEDAGLAPERLSAVGYSYYRPVASNESEEGRSQNRRIEIILAPPLSKVPAGDPGNQS